MKNKQKFKNQFFSSSFLTKTKGRKKLRKKNHKTGKLQTKGEKKKITLKTNFEEQK